MHEPDGGPRNRMRIDAGKAIRDICTNHETSSESMVRVSSRFLDGLFIIHDYKTSILMLTWSNQARLIFCDVIEMLPVFANAQTEMCIRQWVRNRQISRHPVEASYPVLNSIPSNRTVSLLSLDEFTRSVRQKRL